MSVPALKALLPPKARRLLGRIRDFVLSCSERVWLLSIRLAGKPRDRSVRVSYGHRRLAGPEKVTIGGGVKFQRLAGTFPHSPRRFNILYLGSSSLPSSWPALVTLARRRCAPLVWNQNGVAYPAWCAEGWQSVNRPLAAGLLAAQYVFYQSRFCKLSADTFLGSANGEWEILHNAVDTRVFAPAQNGSRCGELVLLLGGTQYQWYRLESALRALAAVIRRGQRARLMVTGDLSWAPDRVATARRAREFARSLGVADFVHYVGAYTQAQAPGVLRRGDILLHTKYNDPCPSLVAEGMACGLPVVFSASGGMPELVGQYAGIGVPAPVDWNQTWAPDPEALADAVIEVAADLAHYSAAARERAVGHLDLRHWVQRHIDVFEKLVAEAPSEDR